MQGNQDLKLHDLAIESESAVLNNDLLINIRITSPDAPAARPPASIICVLDISGSMDTEATQGGSVESDGFSRLDLVKHSVNTIINSLEQNDSLAIVTFSDAARVDFELAQMSEENKNKATEVIGKMKTEGSTNLWDGIRLGLDLSKNEKCKEKNTFVLVFSDGQPNQHPPNGELAATKEYISKNPLSASMSMFGYGYSLDTELLLGLTELGGGCFGYIPDCSMIGTIFVNFLSSALSSFSPQLQAKIQLNKCQMKSFNGGLNNHANLGPIQYGVTRNLLIAFKGIPEEQNLAEVEIYFNENSRQRIPIKLVRKLDVSSEKVKVQKLRNDHIRFLEEARKNALNDIKKYEELAISHLEEMKALQSAFQESDKLLEMLIRDIQSDNSQEGQVAIALSKEEYWVKWGSHYFAALKIAQANQMCTNFKDPGIQLYGGELFKKLQSTFDTVFIHLPPPVPSIQKYDQHGNLHVVADMNSYYDYQGGCIHGECEALMHDGSMKKVKLLKSGDTVMSLRGPAVIRCTVETKVEKVIEVVKFGTGLILTKYHPIYVNRKWSFPVDQAPKVKMYISAYYNFVLDSCHSMVVNGIGCITLGHGFQDEVAKHSYFGTDQVIRDLRKTAGWENGHVQMKSKSFKRNPSTHQVIGIEN